MVQDGLLVGSHVTYICHEGLHFQDGISQKTIECMENLEWSELPHECQGNIGCRNACQKLNLDVKADPIQLSASSWMWSSIIG